MNKQSENNEFASIAVFYHFRNAYIPIVVTVKVLLLGTPFLGRLQAKVGKARFSSTSHKLKIFFIFFLIMDQLTDAQGTNRQQPLILKY